MKKTLIIASLAFGLFAASCSSQEGTEENRTDSAGVINSEPTDSTSLDNNGVLKNADSTLNTDSSMNHVDSLKK